MRVRNRVFDSGQDLNLAPERGAGIQESQSAPEATEKSLALKLFQAEVFGRSAIFDVDPFSDSECVQIRRTGDWA
jgi:hypothetical protein